MKHKLSFSASGEVLDRHRENFKTIMGNEMPDVGTEDKLTINYRLELTFDKPDMLKKLRAMVEMAEDDAMNFDGEMDEETVSSYSEFVRLLEDLQNIARVRKHRELWETKST